MFNAIKKILIAKMPLIKWLYRQKRYHQKRKVFKGLNVEQVFSKIYRDQLWYFGDKPLQQPYYSGSGSYGAPADAYIRFIVDFINKYKISSMVDIGCGDFSIGKQIVDASPEMLYIGCDIVKEVIEYNKNKFGNNNSRISFLHLNACDDSLPSGELLTIRQVFQHLSNEQIMQIMAKAKTYKYVLITEHQLAEGLQQSYNADKTAGPDIRLAKGSGVYLNKPPFNFEVHELLRCKEDSNGKEAYIITYLINSYN